MIAGQKVVVVLPAYFAARTVQRTVAEISREIVDDILLIDDASTDDTVGIARALGLKTFTHEKNRGYGANQKTCYREALRLGADIVIMVHPDYQYTPRLVGAMANMIASGEYDFVLASRVLAQNPRAGGMPIWKYVANRALTAYQNLVMGQHLSEFHTGYRAYTRRLLETLPLETLSDDFLFDNQIICEAISAGFRIGEISCPTKYHPEMSSINFRRSVTYGLGVLKVALKHARWKRA